MPADFQQLIGSSFVSFMLSFMLMKAWLPFAPKRTDAVLLEVPLEPLQRLLVHRTQAILLLLTVLWGSLPLGGEPWLIPGTQPVALAGMVAIVMLPLRYVFTDRGVSINRGVPRSYKTFRRFDVRQGKRWLASNTTIILRGRKLQRGTAPSFVLFVPSSQTATVTRFLKRHVR